MEEAAQREVEPRVGGGEGAHGIVRKIRAAALPRHALEEAHEMAVARARAAQARDRQLRIDARDVQQRLRLQVEDGRILACVRDLEDAAVAAVLDEEGLVALTPQVARFTAQPEKLGRD